MRSRSSVPTPPASAPRRAPRTSSSAARAAGQQRGPRCRAACPADGAITGISAGRPSSRRRRIALHCLQDLRCRNAPRPSPLPRPRVRARSSTESRVRGRRSPGSPRRAGCARAACPCRWAVALAPSRDLLQDGEEAGLAGAAADLEAAATPRLGVEAVGGRAPAGRGHLLVPASSPRPDFSSRLAQLLVGRPQVGHVGQRVGDLALRVRGRWAQSVKRDRLVDARAGQLVAARVS